MRILINSPLLVLIREAKAEGVKKKTGNMSESKAILTGSLLRTESY